MQRDIASNLPNKIDFPGLKTCPNSARPRAERLPAIGCRHQFSEMGRADNPRSYEMSLRREAKAAQKIFEFLQF